MKNGIENGKAPGWIPDALAEVENALQTGHGYVLAERYRRYPKNRLPKTATGRKRLTQMERELRAIAWALHTVDRLRAESARPHPDVEPVTQPAAPNGNGASYGPFAS